MQFVMACWLAAVPGCHTSDEAPLAVKDERPPTMEAALLTVHPQRWPKIVRSQGSLVADEVAVVGAKVAGVVAEVHADLGDHVERGTPLVTLDRQDFRLQVQQARAHLAQARSAVGLQPGQPLDQLDPSSAPPVRQERAVWDEAKASLARATRLQADNAISAFEFDQIVAAERVAEAKYASAINSVREKIALVEVREAELALAQQRVEDAVVRASFDGMVQQRHVAPGTYLQVSDSVVTLVRTNVLRFQGAMPERHAQKLRLGQEVRLQIESVDKQRVVHVTRISPALDRLSRSLVFEAEVENSDRQLRTGLFAEAEIIVDPDEQALIVPVSAVVEFAGAEKVWRVVDGVSSEQEVLTGQRREAGIEILQGLAAGDVIIRDGSQGRIATIQPTESSTTIKLTPVADERMEADQQTGSESPPATAVSG